MFIFNFLFFKKYCFFFSNILRKKSIIYATFFEKMLIGVRRSTAQLFRIQPELKKSFVIFYAKNSNCKSLSIFVYIYHVYMKIKISIRER